MYHDNIKNFHLVMIPWLVAILAPTINCLQWLPQLYKTYVTQRVHDLSLYSLLLILATNLLWLLHGYFIMDMALLVSGTVSVCVNLFLLRLYMLYRRRK